MPDRHGMLSAVQPEGHDGFVEMRAVPTAERCWRCGSRLLRLEPDFQGWSYFCYPCQHVTAPRAEIDERMAGLTAGAVGVVAAVPVHFTFSPD